MPSRSWYCLLGSYTLFIFSTLLSVCCWSWVISTDLFISAWTPPFLLSVPLLTPPRVFYSGSGIFFSFLTFPHVSFSYLLGGGVLRLSIFVKSVLSHMSGKI